MTVHKSEWTAIMLMAVLVIVGCVCLPIISNIIVEPYVFSVFGTHGQDIDSTNLWIASIAAAFIAIVLFAGIGHGKAKKANIYLAGVSADNDARTYKNSLSGETVATSRNMYLENIFGEKRISPVGTVMCIIVIIVAFGFSAIMLPGLF